MLKKETALILRSVTSQDLSSTASGIFLVEVRTKNSVVREKISVVK